MGWEGGRRKGRKERGVNTGGVVDRGGEWGKEGGRKRWGVFLPLNYRDSLGVPHSGEMECVMLIS